MVCGAVVVLGEEAVRGERRSGPPHGCGACEGCSTLVITRGPDDGGCDYEHCHAQSSDSQADGPWWVGSSISCD